MNFTVVKSAHGFVLFGDIWVVDDCSGPLYFEI
jgi:hypothetical protein